MIQTKLIKPRSQDTNTGLLNRQSAPQWSEVIQAYSTAITKEEYELTNMGFTTDYAIINHHIKFQLEIFDQTPQDTSFTKIIDDWEKMYGYGHKFTKNHFDQLIVNFTIADDKRHQAPGYNKAYETVDGRKPEVPPPPNGIERTRDVQKGLFAGVKSAPGLDNYPPPEIKSSYHSNNSNTTINNGPTITTIF